MDKIMKLCIAGKNNIAVECTEYVIQNALVDRAEIVACFNHKESTDVLFQKSFQEYCRRESIKGVVLDELYHIEELILVSLEYDQLIPVANFKSEALFNIHFSFLPKYKGMYTSAWPLLNGEQTSGVTLHKIDKGIDTGDVIDQIEFNIGPDDNCRDLYMKYIHYGIILFKKNIHNILSGSVRTRKQEPVNSSYYSKKSIDYANLHVEMEKTAFEIRNQIRAFNFKEYQIPVIHGHPITSAEILGTKTPQRAGSILIDKAEFLDIATIDYDLRLYKKL